MTQSIDSRTQPTKFDLKRLNQKFDKIHPKDILAWCVASFPTELVQVSTFDVDDLLVTDLLYRELKPKPPIPVLFVDTLHHFPETLDCVVHAKLHYQLKLKIFRVKGLKQKDEFTTQYGEQLWQTDPQQYEQLTQVEPLKRGLKELGAIAWISSYRRDQDPQFADLPIFELDAAGRLRINPLANWTRRETWAYVFEHDVLYNPLHDQGYTIIGDAPTTQPKQAELSEPEEAIPPRRPQPEKTVW